MIRDLVLARAEDDHPALLFEDQRWTWREYVAESLRRSVALQAARRHDGPFHVAVLLENTPEYLFLIAGAALAGATIVGVNPTRRGAELEADINHTDCQLVITDAAQAALLDGLDLRGAPVLLEGGGWRDAVEASRPDGPGAVADGVDDTTLHLLLFTSGSTSAPKAVMCSQGRMGGTAQRAAQSIQLEPGDVLYESMPLFHGNAVMVNWAPALGMGCTIAMRRKFSASAFLPDVRRFGATYFNYVGRALAYVLATPEQPDDHDNPLQRGFGTEASARDMERFSARFGCRLIEGYGSSEGVISIARNPDTPPGALGLPPAALDIAVLDPATGEECPRARFDEHGALVNGDEAIGELVNRSGSGAFEGYYNNPEAVAARLRDGWYWSGDLGYRDTDGWFWFAGRDSDWLRVDSENFAAGPIERIIGRYEPVVMAAVYAVPDPETGDQVMVALELEADATFDVDDFDAFLAAQPDLGTKWAPRFVRLVSPMPLTANNKVNKQPLRKQQWACDDALWWRPAKDEPYRPFTADDAAALRAQFAANSRMHLLPPR